MNNLCQHARATYLKESIGMIAGRSLLLVQLSFLISMEWEPQSTNTDFKQLTDAKLSRAILTCFGVGKRLQDDSFVSPA